MSARTLRVDCVCCLASCPQIERLPHLHVTK